MISANTIAETDEPDEMDSLEIPDEELISTKNISMVQGTFDYPRPVEFGKPLFPENDERMRL